MSFLLDVPTVAAQIAMSQKFVRTHAAELGAVSIGGRLRFRQEHVDAFIESHRLAPRRRRREVTPITRRAKAL